MRCCFMSFQLHIMLSKGVVTVLSLFCVTFASSAQTAPSFSAGVVQGYIDSHELRSPSGLAASRLHPGILYSHNDGDGHHTTVYAINASNAMVVAEFKISSTYNNDWEDMAVGPCSSDDSTSCIYIQDGGERHGHSRQTIYRVKEPATLVSQTIAPDLTYRYNFTELSSTTLMVDNYANLYIIGRVSGGRGRIVELPPEGWGNRDHVWVDSMTYLGTMTSSHTDPEGGDISPDGTEVLIQMSGKVMYWKIANEDIVNGLTHFGVKVPYQKNGTDEGQAVCWSADGSAYYTLSEGRNKPLFKYTRH